MRLAIALCFFLLSLSFSLFAREIKVKVTLSPAGDFVGQSTKVRGFVDKNGANYSADELTIEVGQLKTGIDLRDKHFHERLGGERAKIVVKNAKGSGGKGTGSVTVNKITKPFNFAFKEEGGNVVSRFNLKPSDFGISNVKYLGVGVEDKVTIDVKIPLR